MMRGGEDNLTRVAVESRVCQARVPRHPLKKFDHGLKKPRYPSYSKVHLYMDISVLASVLCVGV